MKIAWCFYGIPKKLEDGFHNINNYINDFSYEVDFFCHAWYTDANTDAIQSPWAIKRDDNIQINTEHLNKITNLYKPKSFLFEKQKSMELEINNLKNSVINNPNNPNIYNALSSCYSTQKTIMLLNDYISKNSINYDFIILSRYDFLKPIKLKLKDISNTYIYAPDIHYKNNRFVISPALLCGGYDIMNKLFINLFTNIFSYKNNEIIKNLIQTELKENFILNHEELILCNLLFNNIHKNSIIFTDKIPNFV